MQHASSGIVMTSGDESPTAAEQRAALLHVWNLVRSNQANVRRWSVLEAGCVRTIPTPFTTPMLLVVPLLAHTRPHAWRGGRMITSGPKGHRL